jgi:hypothetical protein
MIMKRRALLVPLLVLFGATPAAGQSLSGVYVFQSPQGPVTLELQHTGAQVTGTMSGADGSINQLDGTFDGQKATGTIVVGSGAGWFAAGFLEGGLTLLVADVDPTTGQPNIDDGWRLDFIRAPGSQAAAAASAPGPQAAAPQAALAQPSQDSPLVQEWLGHLRGKRVTYRDSYSSNDASGYGGYSNRATAYLCSDGGFHYESRSRVSVDVGGAFGGSGGDDSFSGSWRIVEQNGQVLLQYQRSEQAGTEQGEWIALGYRDGQTFFDNSRVYVTDDNDRCP